MRDIPLQETMARGAAPATPSRRSKRGQPIVQSVAPNSLLLKSSDVPAGVPLYSRPTVPEDLQEDATEIDAPDLQNHETRFYRQFVRRELVAVTRPARVYGRARGESSKTSSQGEYAAKETFSIGDTVLVQSSSKDPSIAVIVAIWEVVDEEREDTGIRVKLHWFIRPAELPKIRAQRPHLENEIYYNTHAVPPVVSSASVISNCTVSSSLPQTPAPSLPPSRRRTGHKATKSADANTNVLLFHCKYARHPLKGLFYDFEWESFQEEWLSGSVWDVPIASLEPASSESPRRRQRKEKADHVVDSIPDPDADEADSSMDAAEVRALVSESEGSEDDIYEAQSEDEEEEELVAEPEDESEPDIPPPPRTPSRKRKRASSIPATPRTPRTPRRAAAPATTPRRPRTTRMALAQPTPHSKAALRKRKRAALAVRPPPPTDAGLAAFDLEAHLGAEGSRDTWLRAMHVLHVAARPEALPCREEEYKRVLRAVEELLEEGSGGCIYISGVPGTGKTATVHAVVRELKRMAEQNEANPFAYVEINGLRIPEPSAAYGLLWEAVCGHDTAKEGHMKISSKEALKLLSGHFSNGARAGPGAHACVVLMDELDQLMTTKQDVVYNFFNWPTLAASKLIVLAVANTMDLPERVMTGRVRSRLGMVRINFQPYTTPQLEKIVHARLANAKEGMPSDTPAVIAPDGIKFAAMKVSSISGDARRVLDICRRTVELVRPRKRTARTDDVKEVIKEMQNSPTAAYLRDLSFHERLMLAAMLKCIKKEGVEEIKWGEVQRQHVTYLNILAGDDEPARRPTAGELGMVLESLLASRAMICEDGVVAARKPEEERRVALNLEHSEIERVLGEVGGMRWKNALSI
ncbi:P-loop containing nucleoside triphosphate hydrolase protein [Obba rivulosa]|uniref:Origin recognition complex subunit 1 n=1 Tax=Obba rivulosa TaxID=1052685 RepID=A0A8E2ANF1_9APHY|nr:P-loop containing nucleoside triphosphate hydrolase protein [Obba rivulosa]